jgi:hypothetical protein
MNRMACALHAIDGGKFTNCMKTTWSTRVRNQRAHHPGCCGKAGLDAGKCVLTWCGVEYVSLS